MRRARIPEGAHRVFRRTCRGIGSHRRKRGKDGGLCTVKLILSGEAGGASTPGVMGPHRGRGRAVDDSYAGGSRGHGCVHGDWSVEVHGNTQGGTRNGGGGHDSISQGTDLL